MSIRNEFKRELDRDSAEWDALQHPHSLVANFFSVVRTRRKAAFVEVLHEIDAKLGDFTRDLHSTDDPEALDATLQMGNYKPNLPHTRPNLHPTQYFADFGHDFFEQSSVLLAEYGDWSWNVCGDLDYGARSLLASLSGPFPEKLLASIDNSKMLDTEFELNISGLSLTAHAPLIAVKLYCFFGSTCLFASDSILQRPSLAPFHPRFSAPPSLSSQESQIFCGDIDHSDNLDDAPITVKIKFKHIRSVRNRQLLFVLHRDIGQEPRHSDAGIASVAVGLETFFSEGLKSVKFPLFSRTVDVDSRGDILGLRNCCTLWTSAADDPGKLAFDLSVPCVLEFQGSLVPLNLYHHDRIVSQSLSFQSFKQFLIECDVQTHEIKSNERFCIELISRQALHRQSAVKFHVVDLSFAAYLPVVCSGDALWVCDCLYEISVLADWSVSEDLCIIVEHGSTFLPICNLKVSKQPIINKISDFDFICMQHPDPKSTSVLIGSLQKSQNQDDSEKFIPEFVSWRSQFIPVASDLVFEGRRFGFERGEQLGCWVSLQERVNVTNGNFDDGFDSSNCVCSLHKKRCDRVVKFSSLVARRIFLCEECVQSRPSQESANIISDVARDGFSFCQKAVGTLLPFCDPSWKLIEQLRTDIQIFQDQDVAAEIEALQRGFVICIEKIRGFVMTCASQCVPEPNFLEAFPASDVSLMYQFMDAICTPGSQGPSSLNPFTPCVFTGYSGRLQVGYAHALQFGNLGYVRTFGSQDNQDTSVWNIIKIDNQAADFDLSLLAFDINFEVFTRGYVNSTARQEAGKVFVKRNVDDSSIKSLSIGFEVDTKHNCLRAVKPRDIAITAWLRQEVIHDVSILPPLFAKTQSKESEAGIYEIVDSDINLVNKELDALISTKPLDAVLETNLANLHFIAACIVHSIANDELFCRLRADVLHVFSNPDALLIFVERMKQLVLLHAPVSDVFDGLSLSHLEPVEQRVLVLASKIISAQNFQPTLKISGLVNDSGFLMTTPKSRAQKDTYYCSRWLGIAAIPGSDGQCGPDDGPQCADCKVAQQLYREFPSTIPVRYLADSSSQLAYMSPPTMQKLQLYCGDYIRLQKNAGEKGVVCSVRLDEVCPNGCILLTPRTCAMLRLRLGENVTVQFCPVSFCKRMMYRLVGKFPSASWSGSIDLDSLLNNVLQADAKIIVRVGDFFCIGSGDSDFRIEIISADPEGVCFLTSDTEKIRDESSFNIAHNEDESPLIFASQLQQRQFPSIGDLVCLQRSDGSSSTLLRKRATSSR